MENGGRVFRRGYIQIENKNCATIKKKRKKKELAKEQRNLLIYVRAHFLASIESVCDFEKVLDTIEYEMECLVRKKFSRCSLD